MYYASSKALTCVLMVEQFIVTLTIINIHSCSERYINVHIRFQSVSDKGKCEIYYVREMTSGWTTTPSK